jgi:hypothetical protein
MLHRWSPRWVSRAEDARLLTWRIPAAQRERTGTSTTHSIVGRPSIRAPAAAIQAGTWELRRMSGSWTRRGRTASSHEIGRPPIRTFVPAERVQVKSPPPRWLIERILRPTFGVCSTIFAQKIAEHRSRNRAIAPSGRRVKTWNALVLSRHRLRLDFTQSWSCDTFIHRRILQARLHAEHTTESTAGVHIRNSSARSGRVDRAAIRIQKVVWRSRQVVLRNSWRREKAWSSAWWRCWRRRSRV